VTELHVAAGSCNPDIGLHFQVAEIGGQVGGSRHMPAVEGQTGLYFNGLHEARAQAQAYDARRQLQALSLELTGLSAEGVAVLER
jgi:hypothetical protein